MRSAESQTAIPDLTLSLILILVLGSLSVRNVKQRDHGLERERVVLSGIFLLGYSEASEPRICRVLSIRLAAIIRMIDPSRSMQYGLRFPLNFT
jgi:hypothetical protein